MISDSRSCYDCSSMTGARDGSGSAQQIENKTKIKRHDCDSATEMNVTDSVRLRGRCGRGVHISKSDAKARAANLCTELQKCVLARQGKPIQTQKCREIA